MITRWNDGMRDCPLSTVPDRKPSSSAPAKKRGAKAKAAAPRSSPAPTSKSAATSFVQVRPDDRTAPPRQPKTYDLVVTNTGNSVTGNGLPVTTGIDVSRPFTVDYQKGLQTREADVESIKLHYKLDGVEQPQVEVARRTTSGPAALVRVPVKLADSRPTGEMEYWFETQTFDGRSLWDDNDGKNHKVNLVPSAGTKVTFDDYYNELIQGRIIAGETLRLNYDADRLRKYLGDQKKNGVNTLGIDAFVSFNGQKAQRMTVAKFDVDGVFRTNEASIEVPLDATNVRIWFKGKGANDEMYDSNQGADYSYPVERR
jgi:hypothetical protein